MSRINWILCISLGILLISGCNSSFQVGDKVVGLQSGKFFYTDGTLRTQYHGASFNEAWKASEKTLTDMKALGIVKNKEISKGTIDAILQDEKVRITVNYVERDVTIVGVRVGIAGDNFSSRLIQDKIKANLDSMK
ncbi:MAG: DUF3568 family protein [Deltaproteobacteria bacterium]|nr:DUF3568 family protein [Deltaproteobacteria bacterium]